MERAGEFLGHVVRRLKQPDATFVWLASAWPSVVGQALASHTRPVRCDGDCLELEADGKAWQRQLETMRRELCSRINQAWGGSLIREIRFVAARPGPHGVRHEIDNEYRPFIRRRRG
jgi:predicted nucleic acid-binding Zn ribbon protein